MAVDFRNIYAMHKTILKNFEQRKIKMKISALHDSG